MLKASDDPITNLTQKDLISLINSKVRIALKKETSRPKAKTDKDIDQEYFVSAKAQVRCFAHESLIILGSDITMPFRWCWGVGTVTKIIKGNEFDLLYINFGRSYGREIIVKDNISRRQLLTLKRGHKATFYGKFKPYVDKKKRLRVIFYAMGLQDWFVPIAADFKELKKASVDLFDSNLPIEEETDYLHFIDEFTKEKKSDGE